jgi:hypothetical protein
MCRPKPVAGQSRKDMTMRTNKMLVAAAGGLMLLSAPGPGYAQLAEAIAFTNRAVTELTDLTGAGNRNLTPFEKVGGADVRQIKKANDLLLEALTKARLGNAPGLAIMKLEEALEATGANQHKEPRVYAQGALFYLCQAANGEPKDVCDKAPKFGSYVAP